MSAENASTSAVLKYIKDKRRDDLKELAAFTNTTAAKPGAKWNGKNSSKRKADGTLTMPDKLHNFDRYAAAAQTSTLQTLGVQGQVCEIGDRVRKMCCCAATTAESP